MASCPRCGNAINGNEINCPVCGENLNVLKQENVNNNVEKKVDVPVGIELPITNPKNEEILNKQQNTVQLVPDDKVESVIDDKEKDLAKNIEPKIEMQKIAKVKSLVDDNKNIDLQKKVVKKKKIKPMYIIILVGVLITFVGIKVILDKKNTKVIPEPNNAASLENTYEYVNSNGYKFKKEKDWILIENGEDVLILNSDESVVMYLKNENYSFSKLSKEKLNSLLEVKSYLSNLEVTDLELGVRKAFLVNVIYEDEESNTDKIEYYYLDGGTDLTIGLYVRYDDESVYEKNNEKVKKLLEDLSYSDETIRTFNIKSKYSAVFSTGRSIFAQVDKSSEKITNEETLD